MNKKILVVIDMQNDFITGSLGTQEAQQIVSNVVQKIESYQRAGERVIYTRDTHDVNYLETQEGQNLPVKHCIKGTVGWELESKIQKTVQENALIIDKPSFGSIQLAEYIKELTLKNPELEVELVGLCTDICVVSNALILKAYCNETKLKVDPTCCAGVTPKTHESALETLRMCQIKVEEN